MAPSGGMGNNGGFSYNEGDKVRIFSKADKQWYNDGVILEVSHASNRVKVRYNNGTTKKWKPMTPEDVRPLTGSDFNAGGSLGSFGTSSGLTPSNDYSTGAST